jgi:hypothetical protein
LTNQWLGNGNKNPPKTYGGLKKRPEPTKKTYLNSQHLKKLGFYLLLSFYKPAEPYAAIGFYFNHINALA